MTYRLYFDPYDTFLIRDGRPFNQDDAGRTAAASRFPPPPDTLYGAARVALARSYGWPGAGDWSHLDGFPAEKFGNWNSQGALTVSGPYFSDDGQVLHAIPAHVYARTEKKTGKMVAIEALQPSNERFETDISGLRLLAMPERNDGLRDEPLSGRFAPVEAVHRIIAGEKIDVDDLGHPSARRFSSGRRSLFVNSMPELPGWGISDLAATELRVGIARNSQTRMVEEGMLYGTAPRRLKEGIDMFVEVDGIEPGPGGLPAAVNLGGEGRFACPRVIEGEPVLSQTQNVAGKYLLYLATPLMLAAGVQPVWDRITGLTGTLVAAAVTGISTQAGFTRTVEQRRRTLSASRQILPAGSVLFVEGDPQQLPQLLGSTDQSHMGYGRYLIGGWNNG